MKTWLPILRTCESQLALCGDALGVLADAMQFRAREPVLNKIMAELALIVAPFGFEMSTTHVWSKQNDVCDRLSRLERRDVLPDVLKQATRSKDERRSWPFLS